MFKIIEKKQLSAGVFYMKVNAPEIARNRKAGQFVIIRATEDGERIPLTVADYDREKGTVAVIFTCNITIDIAYAFFLQWSVTEMRQYIIKRQIKEFSDTGNIPHTHILEVGIEE